MLIHKIAFCPSVVRASVCPPTQEGKEKSRKGREVVGRDKNKYIQDIACSSNKVAMFRYDELFFSLLINTYIQRFITYRDFYFKINILY